MSRLDESISFQTKEGGKLRIGELRRVLQVMRESPDQIDPIAVINTLVHEIDYLAHKLMLAENRVKYLEGTQNGRTY